MKRKLSVPELFKIIHNKPIALNLFAFYAKSQDQEILHKIYYQDDRKIASANLKLISSFSKTDLNEKLEGLKEAEKLYKSQRSYSADAKILDEASRLIARQQKLEAELRQNFVGLSLVETVLRAFTLGQPTLAKKTAREFELTDKSFFRLIKVNVD
jgi:hypothetical protein